MSHQKWINTKSARVVTFGSVTTGAVAGTATQLPSVVCDAVILSINTATPVAIQVGGAAGALGSNFITIGTSNNNFAIPTGGNLSNLAVAPSTAVAATVGYMAIQYDPLY